MVRVEVDPGYMVQFRLGGLSPWELDAANKRWASTYHRTPRGGKVENNFGFWDSENEQRLLGWTDDFRELVEDRIKSSASFGSQVFAIDRPRQMAPWPNYPKLTVQGARTVDKVAESIRDTVDTLGLDPSIVIAYERENENRHEVIAALDEMTQEYEQDVPIEVTA